MAKRKLSPQSDGTEQISFSVWKAISYLDSLTDYREVLCADAEASSSDIWTSIHYLDSPTDYREHLPAHVEHNRRINAGLVTLDEMPKLSWGPLGLIVLAFILISLGLLLTLQIWQRL